MIYMAGDNNLSPAVSRDLAEMEEIGSTKRINVVVQLDTLGGNAKRLFVKKGGASLLEELGEKNMADGPSLQEFILWASVRYPADHYALILWSHGNGFAKARSPTPKILQDDTDHVPCCLSNAIVRQALADAGVHFDLLGFDASQMGQIETAYEFKDRADILVFSQETGQANGWDYTAILDGLTRERSMDGEELSRVIVDSYGSFYESYYEENSIQDQYLTLSAIRLGAGIQALTTALDALSGLFNEGLTGEDTAERVLLSNAIGNARNNAQELNALTVPYVYVDLMNLIEILTLQLKGQPDPTPLVEEIIEKTGAILDLKDEVILSEYHGKDRPDATGLSIVFFQLPEALNTGQTFDTYNDYFPGMDSGNPILFLTDIGWDDFLQTYYHAAGLL
jgi:hypothetical protein